MYFIVSPFMLAPVSGAFTGESEPRGGSRHGFYAFFGGRVPYGRRGQHVEREHKDRGLRITVWDVLGWLGAGMTEEQILDEHPDLEKADFAAGVSVRRRDWP